MAPCIFALAKNLKLLDTAFNLGINAYDLATVYGTKVELTFGNGLKVEGVVQQRPKPRLRNNGFIQRKDLFLIGKGGHPISVQRKPVFWQKISVKI